MISFVALPLSSALVGNSIAPVIPQSKYRRSYRFSSCRQPLCAAKDTSWFELQNDRNTDTVEESYPRHLQWVSLGISGIYLSHFASLYTQLPGLFGQTGLLPVSDRIADLGNSLWALDLFPSPELGMELFTALGIIVSASQIAFGKLRRGPAGVFTFALQWLFWHDLVVAGGRFMEYQMDLLVLDVAPLAVLSASGIAPSAATFGYQWLLSRLYIGAGAVKLLSCDQRWRDLTAVHVHFQSQPLPNPLGAAAYLHLPDGITSACTLFVLVTEMAAPFLFLAPSVVLRRTAFAVNAVLMAGIATFGNFGPLQALLVVVSFALLEEPSPTVSDTDISSDSLPSDEAYRNLPSVAVSAVVVALAAGATFWAASNVGARCVDTLAVSPLVYDLVGLGAIVALLPLFSGGESVGTVLASLVIFAGSAPTMANGLGVALPFNDMFEALNLGASPYHLFGTITGVNGRPVAAIEAAQSVDGPWKYVPVLYQINDPSAPLPLCFPHFPRMDWTLWFIPLGETGTWIARLFHGITVDDPAVMSLLDGPEFHKAFPSEPPAIVRVVPKTFEFGPGERGGTWLASDDSKSPVAVFKKGDMEGAIVSDPSPWPSAPLLRPLASTGRPEYFVWGCLGSSSMARWAMQVKTDDMLDDLREEGKSG